MKLPNAQAVRIPEVKITDYLLSIAHRDGRHKAAFFLRFGFTRDDWTTLAAALTQHASKHEVTRAESTPFGTRFMVEGTIETPSGRSPNIRAVWFVDTGQDVPRFVTAYPLAGASND